jgi:hypothetical protein
LGLADFKNITSSAAKGLKLVGPLPEEYQSYLVLSPAVMVGAPSTN